IAEPTFEPTQCMTNGMFWSVMFFNAISASAGCSLSSNGAVAEVSQLAVRDPIPFVRVEAEGRRAPSYSQPARHFIYVEFFPRRLAQPRLAAWRQIEAADAEPKAKGGMSVSSSRLCSSPSAAAFTARDDRRAFSF